MNNELATEGEGGITGYKSRGRKQKRKWSSIFFPPMSFSRISCKCVFIFYCTPVRFFSIIIIIILHSWYEKYHVCEEGIIFFPRKYMYSPNDGWMDEWTKIHISSWLLFFLQPSAQPYVRLTVTVSLWETLRSVKSFDEIAARVFLLFIVYFFTCSIFLIVLRVARGFRSKQNVNRALWTHKTGSTFHTQLLSICLWVSLLLCGRKLRQKKVAVLSRMIWYDILPPENKPDVLVYFYDGFLLCSDPLLRRRPSSPWNIPPAHFTSSIICKERIDHM